ncbi:MAG: RNase adapter RapZ [Eubacteriales bacterium]
MEAVIITGLSGAGKSQAVNCLEDLGYYCIDNMPPMLIEDFVNLTQNSNKELTKVAFVIDIRGGEFFDYIEPALKRLKTKMIDYKVLFLEASNEVLIRRFSETRRIHPLSGEADTAEGIKKERAKLASLRKISDYIIDTSNMKVSNLREELNSIFVAGEAASFLINVFSFGYKYGMLLEADMVFDMRFIPNPYYVPSLKKLTGNSKKIQEYVLKYDETKVFIDRVTALVEGITDGFMKEGKYHLNLAFACTGGQHRSVSMANIISQKLKDKGYRITVEHRDI